MGFVYKNIDAFTLHAGDIIAFDTGLANDTALQFDLPTLWEDIIGVRQSVT